MPAQGHITHSDQRFILHAAGLKHPGYYLHSVGKEQSPSSGVFTWLELFSTKEAGPMPQIYPVSSKASATRVESRGSCCSQGLGQLPGLSLGCLHPMGPLSL